ncbi:MAG TPA: hypothetical protein EYH07_05240 [Kiloniellaceae bacterium]|nr:hypothetical protein [Kiloniellaceae bacterium]
MSGTAEPDSRARFEHPADFVCAIEEARWSSRPALRRFACFAIEHPLEMAFDPVSRLAVKIGIAPSSLVRCARELGFSGYREMRQWYIGYLRAQSRDAGGLNPKGARPDAQS